MFWALLFLAWAQALPARPINAATAAHAPSYEYHEIHDPNGIGKFYFGREIAHVMGHEAADWLERPEREAEENPTLLLQSLQLQPGQSVADIGAGSGYLSWRMARLVGPSGRVYAVDIQPEMLELISRNTKARGVTNVVPVLGTTNDVRLGKGQVDLAIMVDVYHEFSEPWEMMQSICRGVKPGGRVVLVEYRAEDPTVPIKEVHKMSEAQVRKEMAPLPLVWEKAIETLPRQHILIFRRTASK